MESLNKASYLKGLAAGMKIKPDTDERELILELIAANDILAHELEETLEKFSNIEAFVQRLSSLFDALDDDDDDFDYDDDDDDDDDDDECDDEDCEGCDGCDDDDEMTYETGCPKCGTEIEITEDDLLIGYAVCSKCGEKFEFEFE